MIAVDTNVLLRYLVEDDPVQAQQARVFFEEVLDDSNPGWISLAVVLETAWVLRQTFRAKPEAVRKVVRDLLVTRQLVVEHPELLRAASAVDHDDLSDAIIHLSGQGAGCSHTVTFDRAFARKPGVTLLS